MRQTNPRASNGWGWMALALFGLMVCGPQACVEEEPAEQTPWEDPAYMQRAQDLSPMCRVNVAGKGWVDTETDYLPHVIACENGNAPLEALKAQAIAARTFAKFKMDVERVAIPDSQYGQVYSCGRQPSALHIQAVQETAGQVLTHNGSIIAAFYVSGVTPSTTSCIPSSADKARANATDRLMESRVTYNRGRTGANVLPAQRPMGDPGNPANRGVKSQNGSSCLANQGRPAAGILRFYYGDDIRVTDLGGSCSGEVSDGPGGGDSTPNDPGANDAASCRETDTAPAIVTRAQWGARTAKNNSSVHTPNKITIHHTAGVNRITGGAGVKGIQDYHMNTKGWSDIGYHFLIDQDGTIYQGRPENRVGAHVLNQNTGNLGVSLMGDFMTTAPPDAQMKAAAHLVRYLSKKYNIGLNRTNVKGHGERMSTDCPGTILRGQLDKLVQLADSQTLCDDAGGTPADGSSNDNEYEYKQPEVTLNRAGYIFIRYGNSAEAEEDLELDSVHVLNSNVFYPMKSLVSSSNTDNAQASMGLPDATSCGDRDGKIAKIHPGGHIVYELPEQYVAADYLAFHRGLGGFKGAMLFEDCMHTEKAFGTLEYSRDGKIWINMQPDISVAPPYTTSQISSSISITAPDAMQIPRQVTFEAKGTPDITRVEFYAEQWRLGQSTDVAKDFPLAYRFQGVGRRLISAVGYNAQGEPVASTERYYTVGDGISFISPKDKGTYNSNMVFQVAASEDVAKVEYSDGGTALGASTDKSGNFRLETMLAGMGERTITAKAYDANGKLVDEVTIKITINAMADNFRFAYPNDGGSYKPDLRFLMEVSRPDVTRVVYTADPSFALGESSDRNGQFPKTYTLNKYGKRTITADGYNAQGQKVATAKIQILVTDENGAVPAGSTNDPAPTPNPGTNTGAANDLATEAYKLSSPVYGSRRRADGSSMGSSGRCWHYVKQALYRWGISASEYSRLGGAGSCSAYNFDLAAYCVGVNASANPQTLKSAWGMTKINVAPSAAPRGALITWHKGCNGFNAQYGHIEVAQGDGTACSDYCGRIRAGNPSCANVFVPSN
jgi:hypothetical protein